MWKKICAVMLLAVSPLISHAAEFTEGVHYQKLDAPVKQRMPKRIEVVEAFGYLCPHCNNFEPILEPWVERQPADVNFVRIPVVFSRSWEPMARAYYSSELLKTLDKTHQATFNGIHQERRRFRNADDLAEFYAGLGVDPEKFKKMYDSFATNMKLNIGASKLAGYGVEGVPTLIVNGKYRITTGTAGSHANMLKVAEYLVEKERAAQGG